MISSWLNWIGVYYRECIGISTSYDYHITMPQLVILLFKVRPRRSEWYKSYKPKTAKEWGKRGILSTFYTIRPPRIDFSGRVWPAKP